MKTELEIQELKTSWLHDPIWDIQETEGFEDHKEELLEFSKKCIAEWNQQYEADMKSYCEKLGLIYPDQLKTAQYIKHIETRLTKLEDLIQP